MARSLNRAQLIGNLTRDPELRYTPQGTAVCTFSVATNRQWKTDGETKDSAEFHRVVAWDKLAEICSQMLSRGKRVFVEGRIQTRKWETQDGQPRTTTEIVISDMILLERAPGNYDDSAEPENVPDNFEEEQKASEAKKEEPKEEPKEEINEDDIPF